MITKEKFINFKNSFIIKKYNFYVEEEIHFL
ncbi:hypothetical protein S101468_02244 [Acetobacter pasteurianus subsp. pasteurianus]|uniref:Uncharacterized protein n=1 Tax=Acetobacter pasteurianus subsp. pasteurianus TaxID=481145 RepID=A0AAC9SU73_ACEPA|nr:hypothetical protein S101468_02244 [Acetobacter pasteurianus subsp. pasteurianus]